jgi:hypothetical protein
MVTYLSFQYVAFFKLFITKNSQKFANFKIYNFFTIVGLSIQREI